MSSIEEGTSASGAQGLLYQPYDQFMLFGDSITEFSCNQSMGFAFHPALQNCMFSVPLMDIHNSQKKGAARYADIGQPIYADWM